MGCRPCNLTPEFDNVDIFRIKHHLYALDLPRRRFTNRSNQQLYLSNYGDDSLLSTVPDWTEDALNHRKVWWRAVQQVDERIRVEADAPRCVYLLSDVSSSSSR